MAQFTVGPQTATYNAAASRGFNFVANVDFYINQLDVPTDNQLAGDLASYYVEVNGVQVFLSVNQPGAVITPSIPQILIGDAVTIVGHWNSATQAHNSYAAGAPLTANLEGVPHTFFRAAAGFIADPGFVGGGFGGGFTGSMGRCDVYTSTTPALGLAQNTTYGVGCGNNDLGDGSYYELFDAANPVDLAGTSFTYSWTGDGYVVVPVATAFVPPTGAPLAITDDQVVQLTLPSAFPCTQGLINDIYLSSNGFLSFEATTDSDFSESVLEMLADPTALRFLWDDLNPANASSGPVNAEVDGNGIFHITFTDVPEFSSPAPVNANNVQISLNPNGDIEVKYGTLTLADCIVGFSTGNGSTDPGGIDISAQPAIVVTTGFGPFFSGLELVGTTRPIIGTTWELTTNNLEAVSPVGITFFGDRAAVAIPLTAIGLNAPGCDINLSSLLGNATGIAVAGSSSVSLPLPNTPALIGAMLSAQSIGLSLKNAANITTSNGIEGTVGDS
jgi:hypothetical protein